MRVEPRGAAERRKSGVHDWKTIPTVSSAAVAHLQTRSQISYVRNYSVFCFRSVVS